MASQSYGHLVQRLFDRIQRAGDPVLVCVSWVPDMKNTRQKGFVVKGSFAEFNSRKFLILLQATLAMELSRTVAIVMDLDVTLFSGWVSTLRRCVGVGSADLCFTQRPGFQDGRLQQVNSGLIAMNPQALPFVHACVARSQAHEVIDRHAVTQESEAHAEQSLLNQVLLEIRAGAEDGTAYQPVQWGVYNPLQAHSAFFSMQTLLSTVAHHVTFSGANLADTQLPEADPFIFWFPMFGPFSVLAPHS